VVGCALRRSAPGARALGCYVVGPEPFREGRGADGTSSRVKVPVECHPPQSPSSKKVFENFPLDSTVTN